MLFFLKHHFHKEEKQISAILLFPGVFLKHSVPTEAMYDRVVFEKKILKTFEFL